MVAGPLGRTKKNSRAPRGDTDEIWTYKFGSIWEGVVPIVIVPIPLVLPVGREKVCFALRDGRVVSANVTEAHMVGGIAGYCMDCWGGAFGAFSLNDDSPTGPE